MRAANVPQLPCNTFRLICADLQVDKPGGGEAYLCPHPGGYRIQHGQLRPFPQAAAGPMMLVSGQYILCIACLLIHYLGLCQACIHGVRNLCTQHSTQVPVSLLASYGKLAV